MSVLEWSIQALLMAWFLACAVGQLPQRYSRHVRKFDNIGLIPTWNFFAPRPAQDDFHFLYRDFTTEGIATEWREIATPEWRPWYSFIWNPGRRERKALFDAATVVLREVDGKDRASWALSLPYLLLLQYVSFHPHARNAWATQFLLMRSPGRSGPRTPEALVVSSVHELEL